MQAVVLGVSVAVAMTMLSSGGDVVEGLLV